MAEQQRRLIEKEKWREANPKQANFRDRSVKLNKSDEYPRKQKQAGQSHALSLLLFPDLDNYFCTATDSTGFRVKALIDVKD